MSQGSSSAGPAAAAATPSLTRLRALAPTAGCVLLGIATAVGVWLLARTSGGYDVASWAPAGVVLVLVCGVLLVLGLQPSRSAAVGATAFALYGAWAVLSVLWGGIANEAWRVAAQALIAGTALLVGSLVAGAGRRQIVSAGVLGGLTLYMVETLARLGTGHAPPDWFEGRIIHGPIGYHNAQGSLTAVALALSLGPLVSTRAWVRAAAGASAALALSVLLLTQSRAGLVSAILAVAVVFAWARRTDLAIRALPLLGVGALLIAPLRNVDRALVDEAGSTVDAALSSYVGWTAALCLGFAALAVAPLPAVRIRRLLVGAAAGVAVVALLGVGVSELRSPQPFGGIFETFSDTRLPDAAAAGSTRLVSFSFNGRRDAWRVALDQAQREPVRGEGQGTFARAWVRDRALGELYILQPHSLLLEVAGQLGIVGLALLLGAFAAVGVGVARSTEALAAGCVLGALIALLFQAAVDWTWSFPGLFVPTLMVAGSVCAGRREERPGSLVMTVGAGAAALALVVLAAPWLADRRLTWAEEHRDATPAVVSSAITEALAWNRWDPRAYELRGLLNERAAAFDAAADDYARAADLAQSRWLNLFREARVSRAAGDEARRRAACAAAVSANPVETRLRWAIC